MFGTVYQTPQGRFTVRYVQSKGPGRPGVWEALDQDGCLESVARTQVAVLREIGVQLATLWSPEEMGEIMRDAQAIERDPSLIVRSDGGEVRGLGHWEEMRLGQAEMIRKGDVYVLT